MYINNKILIKIFFYLILILIFYYIIKLVIRIYKFNYQNYINSKTTILITGGCNGIGYNLIKHLFRLFNCRIINIDKDKTKFKQLKEEFKNYNLINIYLDLSENDINFNLILKKINIDINEIDIIINNAGITYNKEFKNLSTNDIINTIKTNLIFAITLYKLFIYNKKIHFVTIASVMSHIISQKSSAYIASKWGLYAFHECIRAEYLYNKNINFTLICPFAVNTNMFKGFRNPFIGIFNILDANKLAYNIVYNIVLKDTVVYYPNYSQIIINIYYAIIPNFIIDIIQKYLFGYATKNLS